MGRRQKEPLQRCYARLPREDITVHPLDGLASPPQSRGFPLPGSVQAAAPVKIHDSLGKAGANISAGLSGGTRTPGAWFDAQGRTPPLRDAVHFVWWHHTQAGAIASDTSPIVSATSPCEPFVRPLGSCHVIAVLRQQRALENTLLQKWWHVGHMSDDWGAIARDWCTW